ncbi:MAG: dprA, partial [Acidimicrobiales bacterium]|nr:dprA [Acidimicrobiales bacterium]
GAPGYPARLARDPEPPAVLFLAGEPRLLDLQAVALVGTRNATRPGRDFAFQLGQGLVEAGVCVVSGLALGIDGAAHRGALAGIDRFDPGASTGTLVGLPIGVLGAGLDITYPRAHAELHAAVQSCGVLVSEVPLGVGPEPWRFPARNRIIAALADAVVVVESRAEGGSMITAEAAANRDVPVLAVPGDVRAPAAAGTNGLLADGAHPARDLDDVLVAIGRGGGHQRRRPGRPADPGDAAVLDAIGWQPATFAHLVGQFGGDLGTVAVRVARLEAEGWIERSDGWLQRVEVRRG